MSPLSHPNVPVVPRSLYRDFYQSDCVTVHKCIHYVKVPFLYNFIFVLPLLKLQAFLSYLILNERGNVANFTPASYLGGGQVRPLIGSFHGTASKAV